MDGGFSASDVLAMRDDHDDAGGMFGGGMWIFALLILLLIGRGGGLFGGAEGGVVPQAATAADVQRATDFAALERQNNETVAAVRSAAYDVSGVVKDTAYNNLSEIRDVSAAVAAAQAQAMQCCCETNRNIDSVKFDIANYISELKQDNANARIASLEQQLSAVQLNNALCGVVRYPNATTWSAGNWNYGGCNNGCGC